MGRKSVRLKRRAQIIEAFTKVLSQHGYAGATMLAVAEQANLSPGLLHHHFRDKREMLHELLGSLVQKFRVSLGERRPGVALTLEDYVDAALKLDERSDSVAAKCWVAILAEGLRDKALMDAIKQKLEFEVQMIEKLSGNKFDFRQSSAVVSYILGALVFGAYAPKRTSGFAAPMGRRILASL